MTSSQLIFSFFFPQGVSVYSFERTREFRIKEFSIQTVERIFKYWCSMGQYSNPDLRLDGHFGLFRFDSYIVSYPGLTITTVHRPLSFGSRRPLFTGLKSGVSYFKAQVIQMCICTCYLYSVELTLSRIHCLSHFWCLWCL